MTQLVALPDGTELAGDYKIVRVLGAGGFGVTYLADEPELTRKVSIKEYFPSDFALRTENHEATPRSESCTSDYNWGLDRFVEEAQTLAKFDHHNIVKVHRIFRANNTAYMVLRFEEGKSLKNWLKDLGRAPRQKELDQIVAPLLDALEVIHKADFLHRDIAPDNIIIRNTGDPVLIDFGAARSDIAAHSKTKTVSALVKPGYSPYEQYAETSRQQGPWSDIYAFAATLYHAVTGKRPPDSPSRMMKDEMVPVRDAALAGYRASFLGAIQQALALSVDARPRSVAEWRGALLAPDPEKPGLFQRLREKTEVWRKEEEEKRATEVVTNAPVPPPPDAPGPKGVMLDFVESLKDPAGAKSKTKPPVAAAAPSAAALKKAAAAEKAKARAEKAKVDKAAKAAKAAEKLPPLPPPPRPAAEKAKSKQKARPNPDVPRRSVTRWLKTKLIMGAAAAAVVFAFHDRIPQFLTAPKAAITTGAIGKTPSAPEPTLTETAEIKAYGAPVERMALSGDGHLIVTAAHEPQLKIWSYDTRYQLGTITLDDGPAVSLAVRNNRVVTGHANGVVAVYDLDTKRRLYSFKRNDATIWAVDFIGSEDRVAAASHDWTVALWETAFESAPVAVLEGHENAVQALAVDPTGRWIASGGADRAVRIWSAETKDMRRLYRNNSDFISALAFSPDGASLATGSLDGTVKLLSMNSYRMQRTLSGHNTRITSLAFSETGDLFASASEDGVVRVRNLKRPRTYLPLSGLGTGATAVAFSSDGRTLLTGGQDGMIRLWSLPEAQVAQRN
ncbi:serine/threonine-protein kinase [Hyphomicrobium sp.]|uniref:serine/threonine-protein kinase n=1 Tax=Hyphomicrobium sp. TaxID=82 RepID=UPI000FA4D9AA|nr:serine/threonine-protein kinase [Hyphomicrobium sp.]RUO98674.1 MAG: serine/threonine protein kinase [Hyphomicrobium sp.]